MKYSIGILTSITLIAAFVLSGCDSPSNQMESSDNSAIEADRDLEMAENEVDAEIQVYRTENENRMREYHRTIEEIKQKISNESDAEVRDRLETKLAEYEEDHRELTQEMENYRSSGRENWDDFKDGFSDSMDDLGDSLENFFSESSTTSSVN